MMVSTRANRRRQLIEQYDFRLTKWLRDASELNSVEEQLDKAGISYVEVRLRSGHCSVWIRGNDQIGGGESIEDEYGDKISSILAY